MKGLLRLAVATFWLTALFSQAQTLTTAQATDHVGRPQRSAERLREKARQAKVAPTFINFDKPYPNPGFNSSHRRF
jgi:hypothetical protein